MGLQTESKVFQHRFEDEGMGDNGPWKRVTYTTAERERFASYDPEHADIPLKQPVTVVYEVKNNKNFIRSVVRPSEGEANQNQSGTTPEALEAVRSQLRSSQGHPGSEDKPDWDAINRGKVRSLYAAQMGVALFNSLPEDERSFEAATQIMDALVDYAFQS